MHPDLDDEEQSIGLYIGMDPVLFTRIMHDYDNLKPRSKREVDQYVGKMVVDLIKSLEY